VTDSIAPFNVFEDKTFKHTCPKLCIYFSHSKFFDIKKFVLQVHGVVYKEYDKYETFVNVNHV